MKNNVPKVVSKKNTVKNREKCLEKGRQNYKENKKKILKVNHD